MLRTATAILVVALWFLECAAWSQEPPQTPQVQSEQQTESGLSGQPEAAKQEKKPNESPTFAPQVGTPASDKESRRNAYQGDQEGTEFWPTRDQVVISTARILGADLVENRLPLLLASILILSMRVGATRVPLRARTLRHREDDT
jgi:hypothetical protein